MGVFSTFGGNLGFGFLSFSYRSSDRQVLISFVVVELRPSTKSVRRHATVDIRLLPSLLFDASHASFFFGRKSCLSWVRGINQSLLTDTFAATSARP